jgi:hypothetical protein
MQDGEARMTASDVRSHLLAALEADLVGPFRKQPDAPEVLPIAPSRWYLTGFLVPRDSPEQADDPTEEDEEIGAGDSTDEPDSTAPDPTIKRRAFLPSSIGLSVFVPRTVHTLTAAVSWADYAQLEKPADSQDHQRRLPWTRLPHQPVEVPVPIDRDALGRGIDVPGSGGLRLQGSFEPTPEGDLALAVFLVNDRQPVLRNRDTTFAFQVRLELTCDAGFLGRANATDQHSKDPDEQILDLQYRDEREYAVGHGVSAEWSGSPGPVKRVSTTWIPRTTVARVEHTPPPGVTVEMDGLASLPDGAAARAALAPLVKAYGAWIDQQRSARVDGPERQDVQAGLVHLMERARDRIALGIDLLERDPQALKAFCLANEAMATAQRHQKRGVTAPAWRLFQLAFVLMNLPGLTDPAHPDRRTVELIFFPTGGGKTEAYLGLIAFTLLFRRLTGAARPDRGLGVTVILRYTLRLLTLDQLERAATLMCALEVMRQQGKAPGDARYSIGLWVGRSATANTLAQAAELITQYKNDNSPSAASPFPLTSCPWCGTAINRDGFLLRPSKTHPEEVAVGCVNIDCDFTLQKDRDGLPVLFVDEQIYRELPAFLISTVDKFALLPWRGETGMLFGRVTSRDGKRFSGPCDGPRAAGPTPLPSGLPPPELIIQDELHLISGPLGSMVGLYEAAIDQLCPSAKLVASTATVRRATQQIRHLYGRGDVAVFPPRGIDPTDSFFAHSVPEGERLYAGVSAPGRPMKTILLRVYVSLLSAAYRLHDARAGASAADPYLTLVGYFNSLRELGGMRRLVEDEVRQQAGKRDGRRPIDLPAEEPHPWYRSRQVREPAELTSRERTADIAYTKARLKRTWSERDKESVDVLLASNMISVGVDIERLGLMVIAGQPKTTSEYIQSSSRVGRAKEKPGLVVTVLNLAKPRDRSHYERFLAYHRSFYRFVEATSVTPYSAPALDRGLSGVLVATSRLGTHALTPPAAVMAVRGHRQALDRLADAIAQRAGEGLDSQAQRDRAVDEVRRRLGNLLDAWQRIIDESNRGAADRSYSRLDPGARGRALLFAFGDDEDEARSDDEEKFMAPLSMRDVEPSVHLWVTPYPLGGRTPRG